MLASVLRKISRGAFVKYLRLLSWYRPAHPPTGPKPIRTSSIISLGRAIVALYLITLLTAVISARTTSEGELGTPGVQKAQPQETAPDFADS
jgi:hypothetical protein